MKIQLLNWQLSLERVFFEEAKLSTMYDNAAHRWQASIDRMGYNHAYRSLFERLKADKSLEALGEGSRVLDAGIGTGALSQALLHHHADVNLTGIDIAPIMLHKAEQQLPADSDLRQASITELPFADDSFDAVMSAHVLEHLPQPSAGIAELLRVLKPGRSFVIVATRTCLATRLLSLKWNFQPMTEDNACHMLHASGADVVQIMPLTTTRRLTRMSLVYTGLKRAHIANILPSSA